MSLKLRQKAFYRVRDLKFDRTSINECEIPDYHAHLLFYSYTVVFFATKSHIEWIFFMESRQVSSIVFLNKT